MKRNQRIKNKLRQNQGWCPNDEKPNKQTIQLQCDLGWCPNDEKANEEKRKEQRINLNRTQDGVQMKRIQRKKE